MQQQEQQALPIHLHPKRRVKHIHEFPAIDEAESALPEQERTDVAAQPTTPIAQMPHESVVVMARPIRKVHQVVQKPRTLPEIPITDGADFIDLDDELPQEAFDVNRMSGAHLMRLSGVMQAMQVQRHTGAMAAVNASQAAPVAFKQQTLSMPVLQAVAKRATRPQPAWKTALGSTTARIVISLVAGIVLLYLTIRSINIQETLHTITTSLLTPLGITYGLLSGGIFIASFSIRGIRWKLFLNPIGKVSTIRAVQLFWIGVFINFLLPIRGGELAKSLMLKRIAGMPISQTLPTVAMDKALDLMPALVIMAIVPLLPGVHMTLQLWLVLSVVASVLVGLIFFIALAVWKRTAAIRFMQLFTRLLPKQVGGGIESFATGFVDSLLAGASQPKIFVPALLLTVVAVLCDGLFAMFAFWAVGLAMPFGMAIFGYTVYNMFCILPNAPAGIGSNEATGGIVFSGLLLYNSSRVQAMFAFSHPWTTLLMASIALLSLSSLGLTITSAMKLRVTPDEKSSNA